MLIKQISFELGIPEAKIMKWVQAAPYSYKEYTVPKKNGGRRKIAQPSKNLKHLQRWVNSAIIRRLAVHPTATAYVKGKNIADNARAHLGSQFIVKIDFKDFFPSIRSSDVNAFLSSYKEALNLKFDDIFLITRILTYKGGLTIGAPSSPLLANAIMYDFDAEAAAIADKFSATYTRYADDITLSSNDGHTLRVVHQAITNLIQKHGSPKLTINEDKTIWLSKKSRRSVTGLILTPDGKLSLGRSKKRELKTLIFEYQRDNLPEDKVEYLKGWLAYSNAVEPSFLAALRKKYAQDTIDKLLFRLD
jgi:retron-type reverse transcriptase